MSLYSETYIYSDQPTTCPFCSARPEIILDLSHTKDTTKVHFCHHCKVEFVMQYDEDFDYLHKKNDKQYLFSNG